MENKKYIEESNKAFETAKLTAYWLYLAGIPEAIEYSKMIHLTEEIHPEEIPYSEEMCFLNPIINEIRYSSINDYIRKSGCKNVLDIACGYSPRGLQLAKEGFYYIGADLPVVAKQLEPIAKSTKMENFEYIGVDATNYESIKAAADKMTGPICIVVEGLGMYLTAKETATVRENISKVMREHEGSVYITPDPGNGYIFFDVISSNYPPERFRQVFGMLFEMYNWASNGGITMQTDKRPIESDIEMLGEAGMIAKQRPLFTTKPELHFFEKVGPEAAEKLTLALEHPFMVTAAADPDFEFSETGEDQFKLESHIENGTLYISLGGRLDSLSSPKLLECFEGNKEDIETVEVDCQELTFLASAGSRVFYLIRKQLEKPDRLVIKNLNEEVEKLIMDDEIIQRL